MVRQQSEAIPGPDLLIQDARTSYHANLHHSLFRTIADGQFGINISYLDTLQGLNLFRTFDASHDERTNQSQDLHPFLDVLCRGCL